MTGLALNARHYWTDLHVITDPSLQSLHLWTYTSTLNLQWWMKTDFVVPLSVREYSFLSLISLQNFKKSAINLLNLYFCNNDSLRYALPSLSVHIIQTKSLRTSFIYHLWLTSEMDHSPYSQTYQWRGRNEILTSSAIHGKGLKDGKFY